MATGSPNETTIKNLIGTFQREVKKEILFDTLDKMHKDLVLTYNTLFIGPLPAVDGFALINLNSQNLTNGPIPRELLGPVAFLDEINTFLLDNYFAGDIYIVGADPVLHFGIGDVVIDPIVPATTYLRMGQISDTRGFISQNLSWSGATFVEDVDAFGFVIDIDDGVLLFHHYDGTDLLETFSFDAYDIACRNQADDATYRFVSLDANDVFLLGEDAETDTTQKGYVGIPVRDTAQLPVAAAVSDAIIAIDSADNTLVYYSGGGRFKIPAGAPF